MMHLNSSLTTRQYERDDLNRPVELTIASDHKAQVTFSATATASSDDALQGTARDISPGGVGIECSQYLPRMCEGTLRVYDRNECTGDVIFEHRVKVQRVYMTSREPTYSLGLAFISPAPDIAERIADVLAIVYEKAKYGAGNDE